VTVGKERPRLKLGKRAAFVKTHLKQLPREKETWEVDFQALPRPAEQPETHYLGLVVALPRGDPLVYLPVEYTPTVNDLADLLADAMRRPLTGSARRPEHLHFRANPRWDELFPHLKELGIEVTLQDELPELEEVYLDFLRQMRKASPGPLIGRRTDFGFVARALDDSRLVFEDGEPRTLVEAMAALDEGLTTWFKQHGIELHETAGR
jgi:hypothetical protein